MDGAQLEVFQRLRATYWPPERGISACTALEVSNQKLLTCVPSGTKILVKLCHLSLPLNGIAELPPWISCLASLTFLRIDGNKIKAIPEEISCLTLLVQLNMSGNLISFIPNAISCLTSLTFLRLDENRISVIAEGISSLTRLNALNIRHNQISVIPPWVSALTLLTALSIRNNRIEELPSEITLLRNLSDFLIEDPDGSTSIKRAPVGIKSLPCWNNHHKPEPAAGVAWRNTRSESLKKLTLYDVENRKAGQSSTSMPSLTSSKLQQPYRNLETSRYADILSEEFEVPSNVIGKGGFGLVFRVTLRAGVFAVKKIGDAALHKGRPGCIDPEVEGEMMLKLVHENIISLYDFGYRGRDLILIMEYADGGDLKSLIQKNGGPLNASDTITFAIHIIRGLSYLHTRTPPIQHRDLKTENVLLVGGVAKLSDFGLSKSGASVNSVTGFKGSRNWSAPEAYDYGKSLGLPSDVYAYGLILWSMVTGEYPFEGKNEREIGFELSKGNLPIPESCPENLSELIGKCWVRDTEARIKADNIEQMLNVTGNPTVLKPNAVSKRVKDMNTAELVSYLEKRAANPLLISFCLENSLNGAELAEISEKELRESIPTLKPFQVRAAMKIIEEAGHA